MGIWYSMVKIAPSILSADFSDLLSDVKAAEVGGADLLHIDVMDGHFVPNITIGPPVIRALANKVDLPFDVHLMIEQPDKFIREFVDAGADIITVHQEACVHLHRTIQAIQGLDVKAGVSVNPATPLSAIEHILEDVDLILIMTVNPGFGGQKFIESQVEKIRELNGLLKERGLDEKVEIEVDGGINLETAPLVANAGVDILVAGSFVFSQKEEIGERIRSLKDLLERPQEA
jgi:ribulose-phosphate 3-epimerase